MRSILCTLFFLCASCGSSREGAQPVEPQVWKKIDESSLPEALQKKRKKIKQASSLLGMDGPEKSWKDLDHEEREMYMVGKFNPVMKEVMLPWSDHYLGADEQISCQTCHGPDMKEVNFRMPSPAVMPLPAPTKKSYARFVEANKVGIEFMEKEVTPAAASLLGDPKLDCSACHTILK